MKFWSKRGGESELLERVVALETALDRLQRDSKAIRLDWEMMFDKLNRMMGRLNARIRKNLDQEGVVHDELAGPEGAPPSGPGNREKLHMARARLGR